GGAPRHQPGRRRRRAGAPLRRGAVAAGLAGPGGPPHRGRHQVRDRAACSLQGRGGRAGHHVLPGSLGQRPRVQGVRRSVAPVREVTMNGNADHFDRARKVLVGGVNSAVRAFRAVGGTPRFIAKAEGAYMWDVEGRQYIDYLGSWGPMIVGHAHPRVVKAVQETALRGLSFGAPNSMETELAELICGLYPHVDRVRFTSSGTEATMSAIRLARGHTGRDRIIKFEGCY